MYEVFDEVADDGVENAQHDKHSHEQVEDVGGQMDCIPGGGYVALEEHCPVLLLETNFQAVLRHLHCCLTVPESAVSAGSLPNASVSSLSHINPVIISQIMIQYYHCAITLIMCIPRGSII